MNAKENMQLFCVQALLGVFCFNLREVYMKIKPKKTAIILLLALLISAVLCAQVATKIVYVTASGTKYHTQDCPSLSKAKEVIPLDEKEAVEKGYKPCTRCKP